MKSTPLYWMLVHTRWKLGMLVMMHPKLYSHRCASPLQLPMFPLILHICDENAISRPSAYTYFADHTIPQSIFPALEAFPFQVGSQKFEVHSDSAAYTESSPFKLWLRYCPSGSGHPPTRCRNQWECGRAEKACLCGDRGARVQTRQHGGVDPNTSHIHFPQHDLVSVVFSSMLLLSHWWIACDR